MDQLWPTGCWPIFAKPSTGRLPGTINFLRQSFAAWRAPSRLTAPAPVSLDEIRCVWAALTSTEAPEPFRNIVRVLLLTAQRRTEVVRMHSDELDGDLWTIPANRNRQLCPSDCRGASMATGADCAEGPRRFHLFDHPRQ